MALTADQITKIRALTTNDIQSVYSGKDGKCCCGCSGKHSYSLKFREQAGKHRGYKIDDDEINDRMVTRVLNIVKSADADILDLGDSYVAAALGGRLYIAYFS